MNDIQKYVDRTQRTTIEAAQLTKLNAHTLASWAQAHQIPYMHTEDTPQQITLHIYGNKNMLIAREGDWIIKHPTHGYDVLPTHIFTHNYTTP